MGSVLRKRHSRSRVLTELSPNLLFSWWPWPILIDICAFERRRVYERNCSRTAHEWQAGTMTTREPERMGRASTLGSKFLLNLIPYRPCTTTPRTRSSFADSGKTKERDSRLPYVNFRQTVFDRNTCNTVQEIKERQPLAVMRKAVSGGRVVWAGRIFGGPKLHSPNLKSCSSGKIGDEEAQTNLYIFSTLQIPVNSEVAVSLSHQVHN
ncbi:hypothetical protein J6590_047928 [Homalodisca vitripennis]|nr:hypothetical protein J6590_047928 [Homalodisca vitripennis]